MSGSIFKDLKHFQLRLKPFYARLCENPWRKNILYLGDKDFIPSLAEEKCLFWGTTQPQRESGSAPPALALFLSTYDELPFEENSIDMIVCHFPESLKSESFLEECYRILAPEGKIIWTINNPHSFYYSASSKKSALSLRKARQALIEYHFEIMSLHAHSFIPCHQWLFLRTLSLHFEKMLCKYCPFWANKISLVAIKKTSHYNPAPSYLRLSQTVLWEAPCAL